MKFTTKAAAITLLSRCFSHVRVLELHQNSGGEDNAFDIIEATPLSRLQKLIIYSNRLGIRSLLLLSRLMDSTTVEEAEIYNRHGERIYAKIEKGVPGFTDISVAVRSVNEFSELKPYLLFCSSLTLDDFPIREEEARELVESLPRLKSLTIENPSQLPLLVGVAHHLERLTLHSCLTDSRATDWLFALSFPNLIALAIASDWADSSHQWVRQFARFINQNTPKLKDLWFYDYTTQLTDVKLEKSPVNHITIPHLEDGAILSQIRRHFKREEEWEILLLDSVISIENVSLSPTDLPAIRSLFPNLRRLNLDLYPLVTATHDQLDVSTTFLGVVDLELRGARLTQREINFLARIFPNITDLFLDCESEGTLDLAGFKHLENDSQKTTSP